MLIRPTTVDEALAVLDEHGSAATLIAGGQSLIPMMSAGLVRPDVLVDLGRIETPAPYRLDGDDVVIGLGCTHRQVELAPSWLAAAAPLLPAAAPHIATLAIRNRGTFLGSLAHGDPSSEWPAVAMALDAELEIASRRHRRTESIHDFLVGPMMTTIDIGEIVVGARWRGVPPDRRTWTGVDVAELAYRHGDYAVVGVVAAVAVDENSVVRHPRIAVFGIGSLPWRAREVEAHIEGAADPDLAGAGDLAARLVDATSDVTASADYRKRMTGVFVRRALDAALGRARERRAREEGC
ncbi:MAG: FAD binding domain-containing protein [Acidimicrobiales bacterium]